MCGINGFVSKSKNSRFAQDIFEKILIEGETRGTDASGIGFAKSSRAFYYAKAPMKASQFITKKKYIEMIEKFNPCILIGHNRAKTQGDKENNYNNHPIVTKTGLILIHNGIIHNDNELFKKYKLARDGEVDTEIIVRMIEYYLIGKKLSVEKAIQKASKEIDGSMAVAMIYAKEPQTLYLFRRTNPLNLAYHKPTGTIFFSSTEHILETGISERHFYFKGLFTEEIPNDDYIFYELKDDTGLKITHRGWTDFEIDEPEVNSNYSRDSRYDNYGKQTSFVRVGDNPIIVERGDDKDIKEAVLKANEDFTITDVIDKPSDFLSEHLLLRLEHLQDVLNNGEFETWYDGGVRELKHEVHGICQSLKARAELTKRDIEIPTPQEIIALLKKPNKNIKLALTEMNYNLIRTYTADQKEELYNLFTDKDDIPFDDDDDKDTPLVN